MDSSPGRNGRHLDVGYATGGRLTRLSQEFNGCRAEYEKQAGPPASAPRAIDRAAQDLKQRWRTVNLVHDNELVGMLLQEKLGSLQSRQIPRCLEVEIDRFARPGDLLRQGRPAHLAWTDDGDRGLRDRVRGRNYVVTALRRVNATRPTRALPSNQTAGGTGKAAPNDRI